MITPPPGSDRFPTLRPAAAWLAAQALTLMREQWALVLATAGTLALLVAKKLWYWQGAHLFLVWNLFLAWIPVGLAQLTVHWWDTRRRWLAWLAGAGWLLFFPNAPYLVTDLVHFKSKSAGPVPAWVDLMVLVYFAWLGVMLGFASLRPLHRAVASRSGPVTGWAFAVLSLAAASFGVYLGRFQRWNSWDVVLEPAALFADVFQRVFNPLDHPRSTAFTAVCFGFLFLAYLTLGIAGTNPSRGGPRK